MKQFSTIKKAIEYINNIGELSNPYLTSIRACYLPGLKRYCLRFRIRGKYRNQLDYLKASEIKSFATYLSMIAVAEAEGETNAPD